MTRRTSKSSRRGCRMRWAGQGFRLAAQRAPVRRRAQPFQVGNRRGGRKGKSGDLRVRTRLHFDGVLAVKSNRLKRDARDAIVSLLAIRFLPKGPDDPAGTIELLFAGGGTIRIDVECIDAGLTDISAEWAARGRPDHDEAWEWHAVSRRRRPTSPRNSNRFDLTEARDGRGCRHSRARDHRRRARARGDVALIELSRRFDHAELTLSTLRLTNAEIAAAHAQCDARALAALDVAAKRIEVYRRRNSQPTTASPTRPAPRSAGAGRRSTASASTCRAARRLIRARC